MGLTVANVEIVAHSQASPGTKTYRLRLHQDSIGLDESTDLDPALFRRLRATAQAGDRAAFLAEAKTATTPPGGWTQEWTDAVWNAGMANWA